MNFKILCQFEMTGANYFSAPPILWLKCAHYRVIADFMGKIYINISCSSCFWIQEYQIC